MSRTKTGCVWGVVVLAAVIALAPVHTVRWSGGFPGGEYRLTFVDQSGRPVPGVTLRVETKAGSVCHLYPVNEFLPGQTPTSDAEGRMTIHHVGGLEFGGTDTGCLLGIWYRRDRAPEYMCVFSLGDREVHRMRYSGLHTPGVNHSVFVVEWDETVGPVRELLADQGDWEACERRLFGEIWNSEFDREQRVARTYFPPRCRAAREQYRPLRAGRTPNHDRSSVTRGTTMPLHDWTGPPGWVRATAGVALNSTTRKLTRGPETTKIRGPNRLGSGTLLPLPPGGLCYTKTMVPAPPSLGPRCRQDTPCEP